jgi:hypothetical protein
LRTIWAAGTARAEDSTGLLRSLGTVRLASSSNTARSHRTHRTSGLLGTIWAAGTLNASNCGRLLNTLHSSGLSVSSRSSGRLKAITTITANSLAETSVLAAEVLLDETSATLAKESNRSTMLRLLLSSCDPGAGVGEVTTDEAKIH